MQSFTHTGTIECTDDITVVGLGIHAIYYYQMQVTSSVMQQFTQYRASTDQSYSLHSMSEVSQ